MKTLLKIICFTVLLGSITNAAIAQNPFITTWQTDNLGTSSSTSITIPTTGAGYFYDVDWNSDGIYDQTGITGDVTHDYGTAGTYTIRITGMFPRIYFNNGGDKEKIMSVDQWGDIEWTSMENAFYGCSNLTTSTTDTPLFSWVTNFSGMFRGASSFNSDINDWGIGIASITNLSWMFFEATSFDQPLNSWWVDNVTDMRGMFGGATSFNQSLSSWDVSSVEHMFHMFNGATSFNQDLSSWTVSSVSNMSWMFQDASAFNQNLSAWDIGNVTSMQDMLSNSGLSTTNYDNTLIGWDNQTVQSNVSLGATGLEYCSGDAARTSLISNDSWTITGDENTCDFVTTWKTDNTGTSSSTSITIPTTGSGYNYNVDWDNDGAYDQTGITGNVTHDFGTAGTYIIRIKGNFPRIYFNNSGDKAKITEINQWGSNAWTSMENAFYGCSNLSLTATDNPDLSNVTSMSYMLANSSINSDINNWDVSNVTNMGGVFREATSFNQSLNSWDVSNVTNMSEMFREATSFNRSIGSWTVNSVTDFSSIFTGATSFNQPLNSWIVTNATNMQEMFAGASSFNQPLDSWIVSNVTDMAVMFSSASSFNQNINSWNVSNVTNMYWMFAGASAFNQPLNSWAASSVTNMSGMFWDATSFNQPLNSWFNTTSLVQDMSYMFYGATAFDQPLNSWVTSNIANLSFMFYGATSFNQNINTWWVANVTNMSNMFNGATAFDQPLNSWNVSSVTNMEKMFYNANAFNQSLGSWTVSGVTNMLQMLYTVSGSLDVNNYDNTLIGWEGNGVQNNVDLGAQNLKYCIGEIARNSLINTHGWNILGDSKDCPNAFISTWKTDNPGTSISTEITIPTIPGETYNYSVDWNSDGAYDQTGITGDITHDFGISGTRTIYITGTFPGIFFNNGGDKEKILRVDQWGDIAWLSMENAFYGCSNLTTTAVDVPNLSAVTNMANMLNGASVFNSNINSWNVSNITNMSGLFKDASAFDQSLSSWTTSAVTNMSGMFSGATSFNQTIDGWTVNLVTDMAYMFENATAFNQPLNSLSVSGITDMSGMFMGATAFNQPIGSWTVSNVQYFTAMFNGASAFNQNISSWTPTSAIVMEGMFKNASVFNQPLNSWNVSAVQSMAEMFKGATAFNQPLNSWTISNVVVVAEMFNGATAFNQNLGGWNIANVTNMIGMLDNSGLDIANYDNTLIGWQSQSPSIHQNVSLGASNLKYCSGETARSSLISFDNWTITGDAKDCPDPFITIWKTDNSGTSNSTSITIPTTGTGYNYDVDWNNDGVFDQFGVTGDVTHDFGTAGTYTIRITGTFPRIYFNNGGDKEKITEISQWGEIVWTSMESAFYGCDELTSTATDQPDLSAVTNMSYMFKEAAFNSPVNAWDVSNITDMSFMFDGAFYFNQPTNLWNTTNVTDMTSMFIGNSEFNQNLGRWDITNVVAMNNMLDNSGLSINNYDNTLIGWEAQSVNPNVDLGALNLKYCNGESARDGLTGIPNWTIAGDTKACTFTTTWKTDNPGTSSNTSITIPTFPGETYSYDVDWDNDGTFDEFGITGDATHDYGTAGTYTVNITGTFPRIHFNDTGDKDKILSVDQWGDNAWTSMEDAFFGCSNLVSTASFAPDLSNVTNISGMFANTSTFNSDINDWNVSNVVHMYRMFWNAIAFNQPLNNWDVSNVVHMRLMFLSATSFNQPLNNWDVGNVTDMSDMFHNATAFNQNLGNWDIGNVTDMAEMLDNSGIDITNYDNTLIGWEAQTVQSNVTLGAIGLEYCAGTSARASLIADHNWTISGDTRNCPFIITVKTDNTGTSNNNQFTIPTNSGETYSYDVDWNNDGVYDDMGTTGDITHNFDPPGTYTIRIKGDFPRIYFNNTGDKDKILSIDNWGSYAWSSMENAFYGCSNLASAATFAPNLLGVSNMAGMFAGASSFNSDVSNWDISNVTYLVGVFNGATAFNQNLGGWTIGNVTHMNGMLDNSGLNLANYDNTLIGWANQSVQSNVSLGSSGLEYCNGETARAFLINSKSWLIDNDTKACPDPFITTWETSNNGTSNNSSIIIPTFNSEYYNYNVDWDNDGIYDEIGIGGEVNHDFGTPGQYTIRIQGTFPRIYFADDGDKEKIVSIDNWGDIEWSSMEGAFYGCANLTSSATDVPDLSAVTNMAGMFAQAVSFNSNIGNWDISNITNMVDMLSGSALDLENYDNTLIGWEAQTVQSNVTLGAENLTYCFGEIARNALINTSGWNILGDSKDCPPIFITTWKTDNPGTSNNTSIVIPTFPGETYNYDVDWGDGNISTGQTTDASHTYSAVGTYTVKITGVFPRIYFYNSGDWAKILSIDNWGDNVWSSMGNAFGGCSNLISTAADVPDLSNVTDMSYMFYDASSFNQPLNNWDVDSVTDMSDMFSGASSFNQPINNWDVDSVTDMSYMFTYASSFNKPLNDWDVDVVTDMEGMFLNATSFNQPLNNWDVDMVADMSGMFWDATSFNQSLNDWDVGNVTGSGMTSMFWGATAFNQPLNNWDVGNVTNMSYMFKSATSFNQNIGGWSIGNVMQMDYMLDNSGMNIDNYDSTLIGWEAQTVQNNVDLGAVGLEYCDAFAARYNLINNSNWIITGDTLQCPCTWVTNTNDSGSGSLREALSCSSANDTIKFSPALNNASIIITGSTLSFSHKVSLFSVFSNNITINASAIDKAFHTNTGIDANMEGLKIICGNSTTVRCLENNSNMILKDVEFIDNNAGTGGTSVLNNGILNIEGNVELQ